MARCIMIQGTMSSAGKSLLAAGLCRLFSQDGWRVAPYKSQNMALNSFITRDGLEMGRAQALQAQAAGVEPDVRMNPLLLKPTGDAGSQVILMGRVLGDYPAAKYFALKKSFWPQLLEAYDSLAAENDILVLEGAGSPAEINLKADDIVNMGLAARVNAPVLLVGDIDRGGVFAQLYGTLALLEEEERARVKGLVINKFRGDEALLAPGLAQLTALTGRPVAGVVPWLDLNLEDEDSLAPRLGRAAPGGAVDVAVIRLPHLSNFTDFDPLEEVPGLGVRYVSDPAALGRPDLVILPGTKTTLDDLLWLRQKGLEKAILALAASGTPVLGICGGYQMLGRSLFDPNGVEGPAGRSLPGLGLLDCETVFAPQKTRTRVACRFEKAEGFWGCLAGAEASGYEIHMGRTDSPRPLCRVWGQFEGGPAPHGEGAFRGSVAGCYLHGLFEEGQALHRLAHALFKAKGLSAPAFGPDHRAQRARQLDFLADTLRKKLDIPALYRMMEGSGR